jgi:CRP-like cAMP-binding protein
MYKFLLNTFLFDSFTEKELSLLEPSLSLKKVRKGKQIFSEGMDASAFFIVVSGKGTGVSKIKRTHRRKR